MAGKDSFFSTARVALVLLIIVAIWTNKASSQEFIKVNSSTKSDIQRILVSDDNSCFFFSSKIYAFNKGSWSRLNLPWEGNINNFFPISKDDIWYSSSLENYTSQVYHYHNGVVENIRPPFANFITGIYFINKDVGIFSSFSELAVCDHGKFILLHPAPTRYSVIKIWGNSTNDFYFITHNGEFFRYKDGVFTHLLTGEKVVDFQFRDSGHGYALTKNRLYAILADKNKILAEDPQLSAFSCFKVLYDETIILAGYKGQLLKFRDGKLKKINSGCHENLACISQSPDGDIWIGGQNGRILYSGKSNIPVYQDTDHGFSAHQLISYGINTDDEYGIGINDVTGDGLPDIYSVCIYSPNRLYVNYMRDKNSLVGFSGFSEEASERQATGNIASEKKESLSDLKLGISEADIDNDGDQDIYLCYLKNRNRLLLNNGKGKFRNVSVQPHRACEDLHRSNSASFADVDLDGDLDLFVANEEGSNRLFENDGTGHFFDITNSAGLQSSGGGMCSSFADINQDGYPDLAVSFWYPGNKLFINESSKGKIHFRDITSQTDIAKVEPAKSNAVVFADVNNDGFNDLFIANRNSHNKLYINNGKGIMLDRSVQFLGPEVYLSNGAVFADFDQDGYQDLYLSNVGECVYYKNIQGKRFEEHTSEFGAELSGYCTGAATGDVDNDGDVDLYVGNYTGGSSKLFLNISGEKRSVKVRLEGIVSNRDAIGAKVWLICNVRPDSLAGYREVTAGGGYSSVSDKEIVFGVSPGQLYRLKIKFPNSSDTLYLENIKAGDVRFVAEQSGIKAFFNKESRSVAGFVRNSENQPELLKYLFLVVLLLFYLIKYHSKERLIFNIQWSSSILILMVFTLINQSLLYHWPSFTFFISIGIALGLLLILLLGTERFVARKQAAKEKVELREKLSRDLHDDLASTLGSISIYSNSMGKALDHPGADIPKLSNKIAGLSQVAMQSISDIIWMTSPRNDTLQRLVAKIHIYLTEIMTDNGIECIVNLDIPEKEMILDEKSRNNLYLIMKEALHNVIKHSGASSIEFNAKLVNGRGLFLLSDNGCGYDEDKDSPAKNRGNGLINMKHRASESGFDLQINSFVGNGTKISISFKI